jgi:hypothetical protein
VDLSLVKTFSRARLELELVRTPLAPANPEIFQMDVLRRRGRERFRLWKGAPDNLVRVTDADRGRRQLTLLVQEPARAFEERVFKRGRLEPPGRMSGAKLLRETAAHWVFERWTPSALRRYLCGMDESHLFIAEFRGGTTVRDAHRRLKPDEVREAERSSPGRILRQGEWFFVPLTRAEAHLLAAAVRGTPWIVRRRESLGGNGRPHAAGEVVRLGREVYARGEVRHPDHQTLLLDGWRRVHRNAEVHQAAFGSNGVFWID